MLRKLFGKEKPTEEILKAPVGGKVVSLEDVPDPVFSQKMMGDGVAIEPKDGQVVSPVEGEVIQVFPTKHAIGLKGKTGIEILIHIGLETVQMEGEGFETLVSQGDKVKVGDVLVRFDKNLIEEKATSSIIPFVLTNGDIIESIDHFEASDAESGVTDLLKITVKN